MTSFYGNASIYGDGGSGNGGTSDYNDLINKPIKNLSGNSDLSSLNYGEYLLSGSYHYNASDTEIKDMSPKTFVTVTKDQTTQEKVITFDYLSDGIIYSRLITYHSDGSYSIFNYSHALSSSVLLFIDEENLVDSGSKTSLIIQD